MRLSFLARHRASAGETLVACEALQAHAWPYARASLPSTVCRFRRKKRRFEYRDYEALRLLSACLACQVVTFSPHTDSAACPPTQHAMDNIQVARPMSIRAKKVLHQERRPEEGPRPDVDCEVACKPSAYDVVHAHRPSHSLVVRIFGAIEASEIELKDPAQF